MFCLNSLHLACLLHLRLCLNIYIVDVLFNLDSDTEDELIRPTREETAIVVGVIYVAPMMVLHLWDILMLGVERRTIALRLVLVG